MAATAGVNVLGVLVGNAQIERSGSDGAIPWMLFLPLLSSIICGLTLGTPMHVSERLAARALVLHRLAGVALLAAVPLATLPWLFTHVEGDFGWSAADRNLVGFTGLALLAARLAGARLSWVPGLLWSMAAATLGSPHSTLVAWDWMVRPDHHGGATLVAIGLGIVGLAAAVSGAKPE